MAVIGMGTVRKHSIEGWVREQSCKQLIQQYTLKKKKKKGNLSHIPIPAVNDQSIKSHLRQYGTGSIAVTCKSKD